MTRITDGDTVHVDFEAGQRNVTVRYIGIDTPETVKADTPVERFGPEASKANAELVDGKRVCLERDVSETDRFGRLLRTVWLPDGTMVNERLVEDGLAQLETVPPDVKYVDRLRAALGRARTAHKGLWGENGN